MPMWCPKYGSGHPQSLEEQSWHLEGNILRGHYVIFYWLFGGFFFAINRKKIYTFLLTSGFCERCIKRTKNAPTKKSTYFILLLYRLFRVFFSGHNMHKLIVLLYWRCNYWILRRKIRRTNHCFIFGYGSTTIL